MKCAVVDRAIGVAEEAGRRILTQRVSRYRRLGICTSELANLYALFYEIIDYDDEICVRFVLRWNIVKINLNASRTRTSTVITSSIIFRFRKF